MKKLSESVESDLCFLELREAFLQFGKTYMYRVHAIKKKNSVRTMYVHLYIHTHMHIRINLVYVCMYVCM